MVALPPLDHTRERIFRAYEAQAAKEPPRLHLGGSLIGHECARYLWYQFRWCGLETFPGRVLRLFETGQREEERVINNLKSIGLRFWASDDGQFSYTHLGGHFACSLDGVCKGVPGAEKTPHLLEIKTHSLKSFTALRKGGVKKAHPRHWAQMQIYMHLAELSRALYFAVCKDTDNIHTERIHADKKAGRALLEKAERIINSPEPLTKHDTPKFPPCVYCSCKPFCYDNKVPAPNCRNCAHSTPAPTGNWVCNGRALTPHRQLAGCEEHIYIPPLIPFSKPTDAGDGWVQYDGFLNAGKSSFPAKDLPHYSSSELAVIDSAIIGNEQLELIRKTFDARVVPCT
jgi:hypothetical protein